MARKPDSVEGKLCPLTYEQFLETAGPITVVIDGQARIVNPKQFASGSYGWFSNEKASLMVGGVAVRVQANVSIVLIGSVPKPKKS